MDRCTVTLAETGDLSPLILGALRSQGVAAEAARLGITNPFPVVSRAWGEVEHALQAFFDAEAKVVNVPGKTEGIDPTMKAYREFLYRSAEYVEVIEKQLQALYDDKKAFKATRWQDRQLSEECNALKHEGMRLAWVSATGQIMRVTGYQVRHLVGDADVECERFHKKALSFSFGLRVRKMLAAAYLLGEEAGRKVIADFGAAVPVANPKISEAMVKATKIGAFVFPSERNVPAPILEITNTGHLKVDSTGGRTVAIAGPYAVSSVFSGDGFTRTFSYGKV